MKLCLQTEIKQSIDIVILFLMIWWSVLLKKDKEKIYEATGAVKAFIKAAAKITPL